MQQQNKHKIVVAITGASGAVYAKVLLDKLQLLKDQIETVGVVMSDNAKDVWKFELDNTDYEKIPFTIYNKSDFYAPFASGSSKYDSMIVCPCSMGTLARIASGISNDLTTRAADVMLKERRKLILVPRETPLNLVHIKNFELLLLAGATILPANPSFYTRPQTVEQVMDTVVARVLDHLGVSNQLAPRWAEEKE